MSTRGTQAVRRRGRGNPLTFVGLLLLVAAVIRELRLPPEQRTWHGVLFGWIPYDLRVPTVERAQQRLWTPEEPRILVPTVFGVGWTVNAAAVVRRLSGAPQGA